VRTGSSTSAGKDYLVDTTSRVILSVEPTPARFRQETLAENGQSLSVRNKLHT
jgi:hypothetical protein